MTSRKTRGTIAFDFDGVLSEGRHYHWPLTGINLDLINQAHERGYAVAVMTCNDVRLVAAELNSRGVAAYADIRMRYKSWPSRPEGRGIVLVTGRKVCATAYVDDRAIRWQFGDDPANVWAVLDGAELDSRENISA